MAKGWGQICRKFQFEVSVEAKEKKLPIKKKKHKQRERKIYSRLTFKDDVLSIQRLKYSFVLSLWSEAKLFIVDCPLTIVSFIDWLGSN